MITKEEAKNVFKNNLVNNEKILYFGEQIKEWKLIDKFIFLFWIILMFFETLNIFVNKNEILLNLFIPSILIIFFIICKPYKKMKNKFPKQYYVITNYRILYAKTTLFFKTKVYFLDIDNIVPYIMKTNKHNYNYYLKFSYPNNDSYEKGITWPYLIFINEEEEAKKIVYIIKEHPTNEEKNLLHNEYKKISFKNIILNLILRIIVLFIISIGMLKLNNVVINNQAILYTFILSIVTCILINIVSSLNKNK